ncbi:Holliday junction resolvase RuvX [Thiohalomonas denitrificans]|uniref:Putative pre-16S rRNA nuclease n=1 Tax=Thiohalomonas denitrificans TaxID=415747 RepID=A0A1G5QJ38_9GAMM|nr:Holliday junction resolvase RuvX [Thiohalomonas denitrificans]SCZ61875.1 putative holliday junction resolvase [Thiohalomonas denitrificans]
MNAKSERTESGNVLGFDYGLRFIGIAVGQTLTGGARELITLRSRDQRPDWEGISQLIEEWRPVALVVGLPLDREGGEQELTHRARRFGNQLRGRYNLPVYMEDERFTSLEASGLLMEAHGSRYRKEDVDRLAARIILQAWLDQHSK